VPRFFASGEVAGYRFIYIKRNTTAKAIAGSEKRKNTIKPVKFLFMTLKKMDASGTLSTNPAIIANSEFPKNFLRIVTNRKSKLMNRKLLMIKSMDLTQKGFFTLSSLLFDLFILPITIIILIFC
jgi:hypothetical protein